MAAIKAKSASSTAGARSSAARSPLQGLPPTLDRTPIVHRARFLYCCCCRHGAAVRVPGGQARVGGRRGAAGADAVSDRCEPCDGPKRGDAARRGSGNPAAASSNRVRADCMHGLWLRRSLHPPHRRPRAAAAAVGWIDCRKANAAAVVAADAAIADARDKFGDVEVYEAQKAKAEAIAATGDKEGAFAGEWWSGRWAGGETKEGARGVPSTLPHAQLRGSTTATRVCACHRCCASALCSLRRDRRADAVHWPEDRHHDGEGAPVHRCGGLG